MSLATTGIFNYLLFSWKAC